MNFRRLISLAIYHRRSARQRFSRSRSQRLELVPKNKQFSDVSSGNTEIDDISADNRPSAARRIKRPRIKRARPIKAIRRLFALAKAHDRVTCGARLRTRRGKKSNLDGEKRRIHFREVTHHGRLPETRAISIIHSLITCCEFCTQSLASRPPIFFIAGLPCPPPPLRHEDDTPIPTLGSVVGEISLENVTSQLFHWSFLRDHVFCAFFLCYYYSATKAISMPSEYRLSIRSYDSANCIRSRTR